MNHSKMSPFEDWQASFKKKKIGRTFLVDLIPICYEPLPCQQLDDWEITFEMCPPRLAGDKTTGQVNIQKLDLLILHMRHQKFASCEILWSDTLTEHFITYTLQVPNQVPGVCVCVWMPTLLPGLDLLNSEMYFFCNFLLQPMVFVRVDIYWSVTPSVWGWFSAYPK